MQIVITYYKNLTRWDIKSYLLFSGSFFEQSKRLGEFITPCKQEISHKEVIDKKYYIISKINFSGELFLRKSEEIETYKGKLFFVPTNTIIFSKINAKHGCIFFNTREPFVVSSEYPVFEINKLVDGKFLWLYLRSEQIKNQLGASSAGMAKVRTSKDSFLDLRVNFSPLTIQKKIVDDWRKAQKEAQELNKKADEKEKTIDDYILSELGIEKKEHKKRDGAFIVRFKDLERWDTYFYREDFFKLNTQFTKISYGKLGDKVFFASRPWSRKDFPSGNFRYVQISDVNKPDGINNFENVAVNEAPSRATQIIKENDIIISTTRPYLAAFAKVSNKFDGCVASSGFSVIEKTTDDLDKNYLLEFLKSFAGLKQFEQRMTGASYPAITQDELEEIKIPLPPLPKQKEIAKKVETIRAEIAEIKNKASVVLETTQKEIGKMLKE